MWASNVDSDVGMCRAIGKLAVSAGRNRVQIGLCRELYGLYMDMGGLKGCYLGLYRVMSGYAGFIAGYVRLLYGSIGI